MDLRLKTDLYYNATIATKHLNTEPPENITVIVNLLEDKYVFLCTKASLLNNNKFFGLNMSNNLSIFYPLKQNHTEIKQ